jgi:fatty-acyl-CoA synthase
MYIGDYLGRRALYTPERLAIIDAGKNPVLRLTYAGLNDRANRLANWLNDHAAVERGDRVAILARDGVEHLDLLHACSKAGAIHTALNWRMHWREIEGLLSQTRPKAILYSGEFTEAIARLKESTDGKPHAIGCTIHLDGDGVPQSVPYGEVLESGRPDRAACEAVGAEDTLCLLFTGGTTGLPKGAMISHRMIAWNVLNTVIHDITHDDVYLNVFPLFHTGGLFTYTSAQVVLGGTTILLRQFDPSLVLETIERERVTVFAGVPTMYQMMTQAPNWDRADLSSLRFCTSGGAPLPVPVIEQYTREKGIRFKQGFGMTEFGPGVFALSPEDAMKKAGSIGRPNFFVDVKVIGEDQTVLGPHQPGELLLKGPSFCSGYYDDPVATGRAVDAEGWFHTGDIVTYDEEWYFYVLDRKKDMFISGGENVYPAEIESVLYRHPAVQMCAVIGVPDQRWGEVGKACVVMKPDAAASPEELVLWLKERLAAYKIPKSVEILDALPLSGMGKILKRELRSRFVRGA